MVVNVCVGSSCHLKGSYDVIQTLKRLIEENGLGGKVELKASFCLGDCSNGVSMKIDDRPIQNATPENIIQIFENEIKNKV